MRKNSKVLIATALTLVVLFASFAKFYHYNYVANTFGQARQLRLPGFDEFFCKGQPIQSSAIDHCGRRSIYADGDWGITAYFTLYGVDTPQEAQAIANFMVAARKSNGQEYIPMNVQIYSVPRSAGGHGPVSKQYLIFNKDFDRRRNEMPTIEFRMDTTGIPHTYIAGSNGAGMLRQGHF